MPPDPGAQRTMVNTEQSQSNMARAESCGTKSDLKGDHPDSLESVAQHRASMEGAAEMMTTGWVLTE